MNDPSSPRHPDDVASRRRARVAALGPPPPSSPGQRFAGRLDEVRREAERSAARARLRRRGVILARVLLGATVGLVTFSRAGLLVAVAVGLGVWAAATAIANLANEAARRRGAAAWDWQAGRHRLLGNPSARVQAADRPDRDRQ